MYMYEPGGRLESGTPNRMTTTVLCSSLNIGPSTYTRNAFDWYFICLYGVENRVVEETHQQIREKRRKKFRNTGVDYYYYYIPSTCQHMRLVACVLVVDYVEEAIVLVVVPM